MNIVNYLNFSALQERISQGYVNVRHHKKLPLDIYCYSKSATFDNVWDEVTCKTRGLIVHSTTGEIIARPFEKFFNLGQTGMPEYSRENLPAGPPVITDKLDGNMITLYPYDGRWFAASKGSFHSEHVDWANVWLVKNCPKQDWPKGYTPVFEMIAEEVEHHVVHYGKAASGLYLLALINNETGEEMENLGPWSYKNNIDAVPLCAIDLQGALSENLKNAEGYVLAWSRPGQSPFRVKVKFTDFLRLQRLVHHTGPKEILDYMSRPELRCYLEEVLNPATSHPVFIQYVHQWQMRFNNLFSAVYGSARMWLEVVQAELGGAPRKAYAEEIKTHGYPGVMFAMLDADGSPASQEKIHKLVWKEVAKLIPAEDDFHGLVTRAVVKIHGGNTCPEVQ